MTGLTEKTAGTVQTIQVTAVNRGSQRDPGYRGTIRFASTDAEAVLPGQYTFTAADKGVRSFTVVLKTAGVHTVEVIDANASTRTGAQSTTVLPGPAVALALTPLSDVTAGVAQNATLVAYDAFDNRATGYRGTVIVDSTDPQAVVPGSQAFTAADAGSRAVSITFKTAGPQSLTFTDDANPALTVASATVTVTAAPVSSLFVTGLEDAEAGSSQRATVTARDPFGNVATSYRGTVGFGSNDPQAALPSPYAFTEADAGTKTFDVTLKTAGSEQSISATDEGDSSLSGQQVVAVSSGPAADLRVTTDLTGRIFNGSRVVTAGDQFAVTVTAVDAFGNTADRYLGQILLTSSDPRTEFGDTKGFWRRDFTAADRGVVTIIDAAFFTKRVYADVASLRVVDTSDDALADRQTFQVLPGPAVRYGSCPVPVTKASRYEDAAAPIGVNDQLGMYFTAVDAYGNNATTREALVFDKDGVQLTPLPGGYVADANVVTSDAQAVDLQGDSFTGVGAARFTASEVDVGPTLDITFRTAGVQTVTVTDPSDATLTITCSYSVRGPEAFTGEIVMADPTVTRNTLMVLPASMFMPSTFMPSKNPAGVVLEQLAGPLANGPNGLAPFGVVSEAAIDGDKFIYLELDPDNAPADTIRCTINAACSVSGPLKITYQLRDIYGNTSAGEITLRPWSAPPASLVPSGWSFTGSGIGGSIVVGDKNLPLDTRVPATVVGTTPTTVTVSRDDGVSVTLAVPDTATLGLVIGKKVFLEFRSVEQPLTIGSYEIVGGCVPGPGIACPVSPFTPVKVIIPNSEDATSIDPKAALILTSLGLDVCFLGSGSNSSCPRISFVGLNDLGGDTEAGSAGGILQGVSSAQLNKPYSYQFAATVDGPAQSITFTVLGDVPDPDATFNKVPPGLTLTSSGRLAGTPTKLGTYVFFVEARSSTSNSTVNARVVLSVVAPPTACAEVSLSGSGISATNVQVVNVSCEDAKPIVESCLKGEPLPPEWKARLNGSTDTTLYTGGESNVSPLSAIGFRPTPGFSCATG